jgi:ADP-ribose pyrophosphatase YjhB (NUDIX family)
MKRSATALIYNNDGKILEVSRKNNHIDLGLPGGAIEDGETEQMAVMREVKEETGYDIMVSHEIMKREDGESMNTTFSCIIINPDQRSPIDEKETGKVEWVDFESIKSGSFGEYNTKLHDSICPKTLSENNVYQNVLTGEYYYILKIMSNTPHYKYYVLESSMATRMMIVDANALDNTGLIKSTIDKYNQDVKRSKSELSISESAKRFAIKSHNDTNHYYGDYLYSYHLQKVVSVGRRYKHLVKDWEVVEGGLWCHDVIEDARMTYNDVSNTINKISADISFALTNERGKNRKERANSNYYKGIRDQEYGVFAKLCDRIANVENSISSGHNMISGYKKEQPNFKRELYIEGDTRFQEMIEYLDKILS